MRIFSPKDLKGEFLERWVRARKEVYRGILRDPAATESQKKLARHKLEATRGGS